MRPNRSLLPWGLIGVLSVHALALAACGGTALSEPDEESILPVAVTPPAASSGGKEAAYPPTSHGAPTIEEGVAALNAFRSLAGLAPVTLDPSWSAACLGHLRYLEHASTTLYQGQCALEHGEPDATNPHHDPLHEQAGAGALLACDRSSPSPLGLGRAVDRWINSLYHRLPLLDPGLVRVGAATHEGFVCLHYASGTVPIDEPRRVLWPPAGAMDVPRAFAGRENPCPTTPGDPHDTTPSMCPSAGFIITSTWYGPEHGYPYASAPVHPVLLAGEQGAVVPLLAWYADGVAGHDPAQGLIPTTVAWVPASTLTAGAVYRAQIGQSSWTFETGTRLE